MAAPRAGTAEAVAALAAGDPGVAVPATAALAWVEGRDSERFLQGLLSNDVAALAPGGAVLALLLDERGHLLALMRVHRDDAEAFTLVLDPGGAEGVVEALHRYHFSEDLEILGPEPAESVVVAEGGPVPDGVRVPGLVAGTVEVVVDDAAAAVAAAGLEALPAAALETLRILRGAVRVGVDTGARTLVQEAALEGRAVSFTKGCYLGQETVARAQHRGRVQRLLRGLHAEAELPAGAEVRLAGRPVGTVGSSAPDPSGGWAALAILRREAEPGARVEVDGAAAAATVVELPAR